MMYPSEDQLARRRVHGIGGDKKFKPGGGLFYAD